ncbi:MAG TPA: ribonuclease domain-containing protein [Hanamia sp.]|nr:ribonuclease domain-containing protein [Hanamia sp.]
MQKNYAQLIFGIIIGLILGLFIGKQIFETSPSKINTKTSPLPSSNIQRENGKTSDVQIPQKVYDVLKYIKANHHPMPGYVGGSVFSNREKILPQEDNAGNPIQYQEWDVNPKIQGQNRGTERIVTGSDGRSWYTNDHYQTFTEIK